MKGRLQHFGRVLGWILHLGGAYLMTGALSGIFNPYLATNGKGKPKSILVPMILVAVISIGVIALARGIIIRYSDDKALAKRTWWRRLGLTAFFVGLFALLAAALL
jgi:hypothetical protein